MPRILTTTDRAFQLCLGEVLVLSSMLAPLRRRCSLARCPWRLSFSVVPASARVVLLPSVGAPPVCAHCPTTSRLAVSVSCDLSPRTGRWPLRFSHGEPSHRRGPSARAHGRRHVPRVRAPAYALRPACSRSPRYDSRCPAVEDASLSGVSLAPSPLRRSSRRAWRSRPSCVPTGDHAGRARLAALLTPFLPSSSSLLVRSS